MKKLFVGAALAACVLGVGALTACGERTPPKTTHEHTPSTEYVVEADKHSLYCTDCGELIKSEAHTPSTEYVVEGDKHSLHCTVCGTETSSAAHTPEAEYTIEADRHYKVCTECGAETSGGAHGGGTATYEQKATCTACGAPYGEILTTDITMSDFIIPAGGFRQVNASVSATQSNSLAVKRGGEFALGTLTAKIKLNGIRADNGIVFGVTNPNNMTSYWEGNGISYYFFFVSQGGTAYLGKTVDGTWAVCGEKAIPGFNYSGEYTLKVVRGETGVKCYVNDVLYVEYGEIVMLKGKGYGLRAGAAGVTYSELRCESYGDLPTLAEGNLEVVSGETAGTASYAVATRNNTLAFVDKQLPSGTYSAKVTALNAGTTGITFGMNASGANYYLFSVNGGAHRVELASFIGGKKTLMYSNYLSAGFSSGMKYEMKVVLTDGKAYCYFNNILYTVAEVTPSGDECGIFAEQAGSLFEEYTTSTSTDIDTCDTLLFGHSYFELWNDWKTDLASVAGLGEYNNIGIGGSIASHWNKMKDSIVTYAPSKIIYMIGINDLTGGVHPSVVAEGVSRLLDELKAELPDLQAVLLSVNYCPARENIRTEIEATNELYRNICGQRDWVNYAEMLTAFCDSGTTPAARWFTDGLHPSAEGYRQKIVPAIVKALNGEDQPEYDESVAERELADAKAAKKCLLSGYDPDAFDGENVEKAKAEYDKAIAAIDACTTKVELNALDLSGYITELQKLSGKADTLFGALKGQTDTTEWEIPTFTAALNASADGKLNLAGDGHRIYDGYQAENLSFTFRLSDLNGEIATGGVLFRATQNSTLGVTGYLINIVTQPNFIQIWYLDEGYGLDKVAHNMVHYIGGWVFPDEVEDTLFRAIVKNDVVYIYTEADYLRLGENGYGCSAALDGSTMNLSLPVIKSGGIGVISWGNNSGTATLEIAKLSIPTSTPATQSSAPRAVDNYIEPKSKKR